jgi:hypothetical protein
MLLNNQNLHRRTTQHRTTTTPKNGPTLQHTMVIGAESNRIGYVGLNDHDAAHLERKFIAFIITAAVATRV